MYVVRPGDTLSKLASQYGTTVTELSRLNNISDPTKLKVGQILVISSDGTVRKRAEPQKSVTLPTPQSLRVKLRSPLSTSKIISKFGERGSRFHEGIDFKAAEGCEIYAAHPGTVIFSGTGLSGYGNMIAVKGEGFMTLYAHNSKNLVERGDEVETGQKIGLTGATGRVSGPHLHFELRIKASDARYYAVDPLPMF